MYLFTRFICANFSTFFLQFFTSVFLVQCFAFTVPSLEVFLKRYALCKSTFTYLLTNVNKLFLMYLFMYFIYLFKLVFLSF